MSILKVNDIRRATTGSATLVFNDPVTITTGSISASVLIGSLPGAVTIGDGTIGKEKLTNDARDWVNILNKPSGLLSSSAQLPTAISGTFITPAGVTASSTIFTSGIFSGSGAGLSNIPNSALVNSTITINGTPTALGSSRTLNTSDIAESSNLYYTDARVKTKMSLEGVVSSSGQINYQSIAGQPTINTTGSDGNKSFTITSGIFITGSTGIDITTDSANAKVTLKTIGGTVSSSAQVQAALPAGVVSSSGQVQPLLPGGTVSSSAQYPGWVTSSNQIIVQNTTGIGALVTTGSNTFIGNQTISGSTTITGNLTVQGTSSVLYTTSSQLNVGTNILTLNTTSTLRYGGFSIVDSGSLTNQSGSLYWDSVNNIWVFVHAGASNTSSIFITGPVNNAGLGNEQFLTTNLLTKAGQTGDHIVNSQISDNGSVVGITGNLHVTGSITASGISGVSYATLTNMPAGLVSSSNQVTATSTTGFTAGVQQVMSDNVVHSGSYLGTATTNNLSEGFTNLYYTDARVKTKLSADAVHSGSFLGTATTTNLTEGSNLYFTNPRVVSALPSNTISSSLQVISNLPAGTVSSSNQINLTNAFGTASQALTASYAINVSGTLATSTDGLPEGTTNLYYTDARVKTKLSAENIHSSSYLGTATTTNLTEGVNLYFTNARVVSALPAGTVSSSAQVSVLIPAGTVSSSAQYPGWVTSSAQINTGSFTGSFTGAHTGSILAAGVVSSSAQYPGWVTSSTQITWSQVVYNTNIVSSSTQVQPLLPNGTVSSSAQYPGWITASSQVDYNSIQNKLAGVVSSSAQVQPLLPGGTVSSSTQTVANVAGQTIAPAIINATGAISGASIQTSGNGTIGGSVTVATSLAVGNIAASVTVGRIDAANDVVAYSTSDSRLKTNIIPMESSLDKILKLNGVEFNWNQEPEIILHHGYGEEKDYGLIAQDVEAIFPEMVQTRDNGFKAVRYERLIPVLVEAIKTLKMELDDLKNSK